MKHILIALTALTLVLSPAAFAAPESKEQNCNNVAEIIVSIAQQRDKGISKQDITAAFTDSSPNIIEAVTALVDIVYDPSAKDISPENLGDTYTQLCMAQ